MLVLFEHGQKRDELKMRFEAKLHGAKIKDQSQTIFTDPGTQENIVSDTILFKDPEVYAKMTEEEKQKETDRLMAFTKRWDSSKPFGGKKPRKLN
jgi:hypothetical protein